jgi:hypothetical protein
MGIWAAFFGFMFATGFIGAKHPGSDPAVWEKACAAGHTKGCQVLAQTLDVQCQHNSASGCFTLGTLLGGGKRLFENESQTKTLKLVETRPLASGIIILIYHPAEHE